MVRVGGLELGIITHYISNRTLLELTIVFLYFTWYLLVLIKISFPKEVIFNSIEYFTLSITYNYNKSILILNILIFIP